MQFFKHTYLSSHVCAHLLIFHSFLYQQLFRCLQWNSLDHLPRRGHSSCLDDGSPLPYCGGLFQCAVNFQYTADSRVSKSAIGRKSILPVNYPTEKIASYNNSHRFPQIKEH